MLANRTIQCAVVFIFFMGVGSLLYLQHVEREIARDLAETAAEARRYEERRQRAQQDAASAVPETEGHWHGDAHPPNSDGDAHTPNSDGDVLIASEEEPEVPPTLTRDELPEALPYPMTQSNRHVWEALVPQAAEDPELMQKLLPDTKEKAFETITHFANLNVFEFRAAFEDAMWRKLAALYPNDPEVLFMATIYMPCGPRATRAEKEAYVDIWERIKRLNDEQGIPLTSELRKTPNLSQTYIDLGEYDKALQNVKEQQERIAELYRTGQHHLFMHHGLLKGSDLANAEELIRRHEAKQAK